MTDHLHINGNSSADPKANGERQLIIAMSIVIVMMVIEFVGGWIANSLALMADSAHMLSDFISLLLSWLSQRYSRRPPDPKRSYGYSRAQILAAFLNGLGLVLISTMILYSSIQRLIMPSFTILSSYMLLITIIGTFANILIIIILKSIKSNALNIRSAILHAMSDLACSLIAILCALIIKYTGFVLADTLLSILVSTLMVKSAYSIIKESAHILLEGAPEYIEQTTIKEVLIGHFGIIDVHHIHVWMLVENYSIATLHIVVKDNCHDIPNVIRKAKARLQKLCNIQHLTLEVEEESWSCSDDERF